VGVDFSVEQDGDVTYATITTNGTSGTPQSANRVITWEVTFPAAQSYDLYVRCRVGPGGFDDDSFFYGATFGTPSIADAEAWVRVNNIANIGYTAGLEIVDGAGGAGSNTWKWINLSEFTGDEPPVVFSVTEGELVQTFQIGAREDGLDFDKIAFARADYYYTVSNLDNGEEGTNDPSGNTMSPIAEGKPKFLGNVYSGAQVPGFTNYWNQVTPENAGKWGSVEGTRDVMNWTQLDAAYALAQDNDFYYKHHVLIWGNQQPAWIESLPVNEQREEIEEWMAAVAERYPDLDAIEVVNEPLHDPPNTTGSGGGNYINALGGYGESGWEWVLEAFRMARTYFPNAELMLNDYNIVNSVSNTNEYLELIELLQAEDLIDQIGVQGHAFSTANASVTTMQNNLDALAETGLPIYVTELDIDGATDAEQLAEYQRVFPVFWEHPAVMGITLWGFRPGMWRTEQGAYLIEDDGVTERPALIWLRMYVEGTLDAETVSANTDHVLIYPNPLSSSATTLFIEGLDRPESAELWDLSGRLLWSGQPQGNLLRFPAPYAQGMYLLRLYEDGQVYSRKLMIYP
jgi:endo-1,4-beta-xylanase